jgi:hypothetical protein
MPDQTTLPSTAGEMGKTSNQSCTEDYWNTKQYLTVIRFFKCNQALLSAIGVIGRLLA